MSEKHKRRIVVAFDLEVRDDYWQERHIENDYLLSDVATYLACRIENDSKLDDPYNLTNPIVYWPEDFIADVAEGNWKEDTDD